MGLARAFTSLTIVALIVSGCRCGTPAPSPSTCAPPGSTVSLADFSDDYQAALTRARTWLDRIDADPVALRAANVKGKKKFVELLDAYYAYWRAASPAERRAIEARVREVSAVTRTPAYHDMLEVSDLVFKQDSTSYLRAALLLERMGFDITAYRRSIAAIHGRLDAHLPSRGPHQRRVFAWYYDHFGLARPPLLDDALSRGVIARRIEPTAYDTAQVYELTHEIYGPYEYGDRLDAQPFSTDDLSYLDEVLPVLLRRSIDVKNADLVAELISAARMVRLVASPEYAEALRYLIRDQRADGSWGRYGRARKRMGDLVDVQLTLHTTMVAASALMLALHPEWNRPCP